MKILRSVAGTAHCRSLAKATNPQRSHSFLVLLARLISRSANEHKDQSCSATTANDSTVAPRTDGFARSANAPESDQCTRTCSEPRSSWPLDAGVPLRDVQIAARHADPRTTATYDRRRENFDRHAAYVVVAFVTGG